MGLERAYLVTPVLQAGSMRAQRYFRYSGWRLSSDAQFGAAWRDRVTDAVTVMLGGGLNYSQILLTATDAQGFTDVFAFGVLGPGVISDIALDMTERISISLMLRGGYNAFPVWGDLTESGINYSGSWAFTPALAIGLNH